MAPKSKAITEFQEFHNAAEVLYRLVENYVSMRDKELHTEILGFLVIVTNYLKCIDGY